MELSSSEMSEFGQAILDNSITKKTKRDYERKNQHFMEWIAVNNTEDIGQDDLVSILPVSPKCLTDFIASICLKKNRKTGEVITPIVYNSTAHVYSYVSSIKYLYKTNNISMDYESQVEIAKFLAGFTRRVASLKLEGEIPMEEGNVNHL
jgi:hypothetical protein